MAAKEFWLPWCNAHGALLEHMHIQVVQSAHSCLTACLPIWQSTLCSFWLTVSAVDYMFFFIYAIQIRTLKALYGSNHTHYKLFFINILFDPTARSNFLQTALFWIPPPPPLSLMYMSCFSSGSTIPMACSIRGRRCSLSLRQTAVWVIKMHHVTIPSVCKFGWGRKSKSCSPLSFENKRQCRRHVEKSEQAFLFSVSLYIFVSDWFSKGKIEASGKWREKGRASEALSETEKNALCSSWEWHPERSANAVSQLPWSRSWFFF